MKKLKVVFLVTIFFCCSCKDVIHSKSKNDAQTHEIFKNLDKEVKMKIDSFILKDTNHIYAIYINRTSNNTNLFVFIVQHIDYLKYYGLPFSISQGDNKLILFYCGLESVIPTINANDKKETFISFCKKFRINKIIGQTNDSDFLSLKISNEGKLLGEVDINDYTCFLNAIHDTATFVPPAISP